MKFNFKLSEDCPTQHIIIMVGAGVFIFINTIDMFRSKSDSNSGMPVKKMTQVVDENSGSVAVVETRYQNPQMSWYELLFCRGFKHSNSCSKKMWHPKAEEASEYGVKIPEGAPVQKNVLAFKENVRKNSSFSNVVSID